MNARLPVLAVLVVLLVALVGATEANWSETFDNGMFDVPTWQFRAYPEITGTFDAVIETGLDGNGYLALTETNPASVGGSASGVGMGSTEEFVDVRLGSVINLSGDTSRSYQGLAVRATYFLDDGSVSGFPGIITSGYIMFIQWQEGPANVRIEVLKILNSEDTVMKTYVEVPVPGLNFTRPFYAELEAVGAGPVYITGSLYESKGGALLARTPTWIDTNAADAWEKPGVQDAVYARGASAVFMMNQNLAYPGYRGTFDDVYSAADGPAAVNPTPANQAEAVSPDTALHWVEAAFATSRQLWLGPAGAMQLVGPGPTGTSYDPGLLEFGETYQWRVDQLGPAGTVTGHVWTFTTDDGIIVEDFESYADDAEIASTWVHNVTGYDYIFSESSQVDRGTKAMRFTCQNQYEPFFTEATRSFEPAQDWTRADVQTLSLAFRGSTDNIEQAMYVRVEDASGTAGTVTLPYNYMVQSKFWRQWGIDLAEFSGKGVDLANVAKLTIGFGSGTNSGQLNEDLDTIYIDTIRLCRTPDLDN
jgi:hypothetical protein